MPHASTLRASQSLVDVRVANTPTPDVAAAADDDEHMGTALLARHRPPPRIYKNSWCLLPQITTLQRAVNTLQHFLGAFAAHKGSCAKSGWFPSLHASAARKSAGS
jgi:hypothetical protein